MKTILVLSAILFLFGTAYSQPNVTGTKFPKDRDSNPVSVTYYWDSSSSTYKPSGPSGVVFDRMEGQYVTNVSTSTASASALNLTSSFEPAGVVVKNHGTGTLAIWFSMENNPSGASVPDTFWVDPGTSAYFPIDADSIYSYEATTVPELEIQQGRNN